MINFISIRFGQIQHTQIRRFRGNRTTYNATSKIKKFSICLQFVLAFLGIALYFLRQELPTFSQNENIDQEARKILKDINPNNITINRTKIYYVYHRGSSYVDPVDPKGERCLIPWDYTKDKTKAQLIVYNALDNYFDITKPRDPTLRPDQLTCIESMESSTNYPSLYVNRKSFNYTMFYSLTSDVPIPYAEFFESNELPLNISEKEGKLVCAFISNCHATNKRTDFVKELMKYIKIDSFGSCLNNAKVPSELSRGNKYRTKEAVIRYYKFTIAFENSNDPDYISEKLFQPLRYGSVPIYRGCQNLEDFAPPHSTIDANKFNSAKELADYLHYLDQNDTAYNEYFQWKYDNNIGHMPRIRFFRDRNESSICALVERIHGLWINPYLTDWKRVTESEMMCNKCLDDFDLEHRRIPILRDDGWSYDYPLGEYWENILNISTKPKIKTIEAYHVKTNKKVSSYNLVFLNRFFSSFAPLI